MDGHEHTTLAVDVQSCGTAWRVVVSGFESAESAKEWADGPGSKPPLGDHSKADHHALLLETCSSMGRIRAMLRGGEALEQGDREAAADLLDCMEEYVVMTWPVPEPQA